MACGARCQIFAHAVLYRGEPSEWNSVAMSPGQFLRSHGTKAAGFMNDQSDVMV